nr:hypothetical protein BaRGS_019502 [Batillaria attramentaria]KAG5697898.1 hypothetical protein BaRGS_026836 [Batillaria attramentaria]
MPGQANPFGAGGAPPAFGQAPASTPSSFGYQQQFPVQNGGFGMASTAAGFAYSSAPATYGVAPQGFQAQPASLAAGKIII